VIVRVRTVQGSDEVRSGQVFSTPRVFEAAPNASPDRFPQAAGLAGSARGGPGDRYPASDCDVGFSYADAAVVRGTNAFRIPGLRSPAAMAPHASGQSCVQPRVRA
jgi:hypothetical protein